MSDRYAALTMCYNRTPEQLQLTKESLRSILAQDIGPLYLLIINNGSTLKTAEYLKQFADDVNGSDSPHQVVLWESQENRSPVVWANAASAVLFKMFDTVLGFPNDVILPPNLYRELGRWPRGFVTASATAERSIPGLDSARAISENTPMAVMLTRKWAYDALVAKDGYFLDENYFHYASDCDLALRMAACGIRGVQLDLQYWHYGSASWRLAPAAEGKAMTDQADRDRAHFVKKYGFTVDSPEYSLAASDINFRG